MAAQVLMADEAVDRLAELGLSVDLVERVVRQADAEASFCTPLDPPIMEGLTRWARTNRFLREELIPLGWQFDNPRNLPRTIHPGGQFAIVATTGDDITGLADLLPAPKYAKGYATTRAVEVNEQLTLDFGDFDLAGLPPRDHLQTWLLLFHVDDDGFHVELSLPDASTTAASRAGRSGSSCPSSPGTRSGSPTAGSPDPPGTGHRRPGQPAVTPGGPAADLTPSRLVIARKRRGLTLTQLAGLTGLSTRSISLYENGHAEPSAETLRPARRGAGRVPGFLGAPDVDEIPVDAVSFRALSKMTARQRDRALSAGRVALLINDWIDARFRLPDTDIPCLTGHDPESAAQVVRAHWGLGERPVSNVLHLVESRGVRIYSLTAENTELDAYSLYWHGRPFIFLDTAKSGERGRFDAAHELGPPRAARRAPGAQPPAAEAEANRFAAAFLMPRASVLAQGLRDATPARILEAKRIWKVSAMALTHRLYELDLLTDWGYRTACVQLSRLGYRHGEPRGIDRESSQLLAKVFRSIRDGGETPATVASSIGISTSELRSHVFGLTLTSVPGDGQPVTTRPRHGLRLVPPPG